MTNQLVIGNFGKPKTTETWKVSRSRTQNDERRGRRHLQKQEIATIIKAIRKGSRYPDRDELMVLMTYHHGFRVSELCNVRWQHLDLKTGQISIKRAKNGIDTVHPISDKRELMLLRRLHRAQDKPSAGFVFQTERKTAVSVNGFQKIFSKFSEQALGTKWNVHALRHGCGTELVSAGHDLRTVQVYMGHKNIQNTVQYVHESAKQFEKIEW